MKTKPQNQRSKKILFELQFKATLPLMITGQLQKLVIDYSVGYGSKALS